MKKTVAIILAGIMLVSVAGCKKKNKTTEKTKETSEVSVETGESKKSGESIVARLDIDPKDPEVGKFEFAKALEEGDITFTSLDKTIVIGDHEAEVMASGAQVTITAQYLAKDKKTVTLDVLPYSSSYRWNKSDAVVTVPVEFEVYDGIGTAEFKFEIPDDLNFGNYYAFVFMDGDDAVAYFQSMILKNETDTTIDG